MTDFDERMAQLRARFQVRAAEDRERLAVALATQDRAETRRLAHGLSGTGGVFGFAGLSSAAEAVELAVDADCAWEEVEKLCAILLRALAEAAQPV